MKKEEISQIMNNEDFVNEILDMQTSEEVQEAFKQKGLEISLEEVKFISLMINKMVEKNSTELSEKELSEIAGGAFKNNFSNTPELDLEIAKKLAQSANK